jgi:AraC family transcriptional regulator of adaptative response/methylated-DNA-[protein]-cysteine methyltransferase
MMAFFDSVAQDDYARVERAIRYIDQHRQEQPELEAVADVMGLSPGHAQRVFARWAGLSPKQFLGLVTLEEAKRRLREADSVLGAALDAGLSGPSRLHDLFVKVEAITPGEYKAQGAALTMRWAVHPTPFGDAMFVLSERGLARLALIAREPVPDVLAEARAAWPLSTFVADPEATAPVARRIFQLGKPTDAGQDPSDEGEPLRLLLKGSPFQVQVWRALLQIPPGVAVTYGGLARALGHGRAARAVGTACGQNRIGFLIPCHRVLRETGALGGYRWGLPMKRAMLAWETGAGPRLADNERRDAA